MVMDAVCRSSVAQTTETHPLIGRSAHGSRQIRALAHARPTRRRGRLDLPGAPSPTSKLSTTLSERGLRAIVGVVTMGEEAPRSVILEVDAIDGGYFIAALGPDADSWEPTNFPADVGEILADQHCVVVNTLGGAGGDERVLLAAILLDREMGASEIARRSEAASSTAEFSLVAQGRLVVLSNELEHQGFLTSRATPLHLRGVLFMQLNPNTTDPGDPVEQHHLRLWPESVEDRDQRWWTEP